MSSSSHTSFEYERESVGTPNTGIPSIPNRTKSTGSCSVKFISILIILLSGFQMLCSAKAYDMSYDGSWWAGMICCISGILSLIADSRLGTTPWYYHAIRVIAVFACIAGTANDSKYRTMGRLNTCMSSETNEIYGSTLHLDHAELCLEKHSSQDCVCVMHESVYCSTHNLNNSNTNCGIFLNIIPRLLLISMISCVGLLLLMILQSCCLRRKIARTTSRFVPRRIPLWEIAVNNVSFESNSDNSSSSDNTSNEYNLNNNTTIDIATTRDRVRQLRSGYTLTLPPLSTTITSKPSNYTEHNEQKEDEEDSHHHTHNNHTTTNHPSNNNNNTSTPSTTTIQQQIEERLPEDVELGRIPTQCMLVEATAIPIQSSTLKPVSVRAYAVATHYDL